MAVTASGWYLVNWIDVLDATQLAFDLSLTTHKQALYTNSLTPNFSTDSAYSATNEVSGTNYTAGGFTIATLGGSPTLTEDPTGTIKYDMADSTFANITVTNSRALIQYADALAGNNLQFLINFGADFPVSAGNLVVQWASGGVMTLDGTP